MKSTLPYPGKYESFQSWDSRCREWEFNRELNRQANRYQHKAWITGRPTMSGTEVGEFQTTVNGQTVTAVRIGYGAKAAAGVERYARKHGLLSHSYVGNGQRGKYARYDSIAYKSTTQP